MTEVINQNYVFNPSFRLGTDGWAALDSTINHLTAGGFSGTDCLQVVKTVEEYSGVQNAKYTSVNTRGKTYNYTASAYVSVPTGEENATLMLSILWYTSGKTYISSSDATPVSVTNGAGWTRLTLTNQSAPATARYASVRVVQTTAGSAGEIFLLDAVQLEIGATATEFVELTTQGQETAVVNRGLSPVPTPHLTGMELRADIELNGLIFNTIDEDGFVWVITDITGLHQNPEPEFPELSRGYYADGDFDTRGRYKARYLNISGSLLLPDSSYVSEARDKLIRAVNLVYSGAWLKLKSPNETVKALFVRLNGAVETTVVNPRGRIDFSFGLKAADPVIYEWNEEREDGYFVANTYATNYSGTQLGIAEVGHAGNYNVGAVYEVRGPIIGGNASLFNYANGDLATITGSVRGERYRSISQKKMEDFVATLKFTRTHDLVAGDEILVSLTETVPLTQVARGSGNTYATLTTTDTYGISNGDKVILANVDSSLNGSVLEISNVTATTFTVPSANTVALSNASLSSASATDYTNQLFNGTQYVDYVPNNRSVTYRTARRETVALANVNNQSVTYLRNVVYKDADYLEVDTRTNEVALNGDVVGQRGKLDALIDWVKLQPGSNEIELDDSNQTPLYVNKYFVAPSSTKATIYTTLPHGLEVNDNLHIEHVDNASTDIFDTTGLAHVSSYSQSATTATITTSSAHGYSNGNVVMLTGVSRAVDGQRTVANVTSTTFTVTTTESNSVLPTDVLGTAKKLILVTQYAKSNNTVTLTAPSHGFLAGEAIYVTNVHEDLDGQAWITAVPNTSTIQYDTRTRVPAGKITTTAAPSAAQISRRYPATEVTEYSVTYETGRTLAAINASGVTTNTNVAFGMFASVDGLYAPVESVERRNNVATVTTFTKHGFAVGDFINVEGSEFSDFQVGYGNPKAITAYTISGKSVTIDVANHGLVANDTLTVYGVNTGVEGIEINGTYTVTSVVTNVSITYAMDTANKVEYTTAARQIASNIATVYLSEVPKFEATDSDGNATRVDVAAVSGITDGTYDVISVDATDNTITFAFVAGDSAYTADTDGTVSLVLDKTPERAFMYQKNEIMYYTINNSTTNSIAEVSGGYVWMRTLNDHGLAAGDSVDIVGLSSLVNGTQTVYSNVNATAFIVKIDNTALVKRKTSTAVRNAGSNYVTLTSASHGFNPGDWVYVDSGTVNFPDGKYEVKTRPNTNAFQIYASGNTTAFSLATVHGIYPLRQGAYAVECFPILAKPAPTDYTFSYRNPSANANVNVSSVVYRTGELVQNSDAKLKVFYRSGWIG